MKKLKIILATCLITVAMIMVSSVTVYAEPDNYLDEIIPNPSCELKYNKDYELLISVMLSAQTTDKSVNLVTPNLFMKYPTALSLSNAEYDDVKSIIARLGLSSNKAKNIIATSKMLVEMYNGVVPSTLEELITLPGVGRKTANVVLSEGYKIPRIAVDTHVERVSKRLYLAALNDARADSSAVTAAL